MSLVLRSLPSNLSHKPKRRRPSNADGVHIVLFRAVEWLSRDSLIVDSRKHGLVFSRTISLRRGHGAFLWTTLVPAPQGALRNEPQWQPPLVAVDLFHQYEARTRRVGDATRTGRGGEAGHSLAKEPCARLLGTRPRWPLGLDAPASRIRDSKNAFSQACIGASHGEPHPLRGRLIRGRSAIMAPCRSTHALVALRDGAFSPKHTHLLM